jgi:hypothetical protein
MHNVTKKIKRELTRSPKKAALLAVLSAAGVYFWAPLVAGWVAPESRGTRPSASKEEPQRRAPSSTRTHQALAADDDALAGMPSWEKVVEWISADDRTKPGRIVARQRNPFLQTLVDEIQPESSDKLKTKAQVKPPEDLTPQQAGLKLESVVYGSRRRLVVINDQVYRLQDSIPVPIASVDKSQDRSTNTQDHPSTTIPFQLVEIRRKSVLLSRRDKSYELELFGNEQSGGIRIRRIGADASPSK